MTVSFREINKNTLVPFLYLEFGKLSEATSLPTDKRVLLIGNALKNTGKLVEVFSEKQSKDTFGKGSILHRMAKRFFENNVTQSVRCYGVADPTGAAAAAAVGKINLSGRASNNGEIKLTIGNDEVRVPVANGAVAKAEEDEASVSNDFIDAVNDLDLAVTASLDEENSTATAGVISLTAKNKGKAGKVKLAYDGRQKGVEGIAVSVRQMTGGTGNYDIAPALAAIGAGHYHLIAMPYDDEDNLNKLDVFLADKFSAENLKEGIGFVGIEGNHSELITTASKFNSKFLCLIDSNRPGPAYELVSALVAKVAKSVSDDPALHYHALHLKGIKEKKLEETFNHLENDALLANGVSILDDDHGVRIKSLVTTYQRDEEGNQDDRFKEVVSVFLAGYLRADFAHYLRQKYLRAKLGEDGVNYDPKQLVVTPVLIKGEWLAKYREWLFKGYVQGYDEIKKNISITKDGDRLVFSADLKMINQLRIFLGKINV